MVNKITITRSFGYYTDHMSISDLTPLLDRQLLLQLGDRLKRLRVSRGLSAVDMAAQLGITRNTLRAVEAGDPATAIGTYLRVMSALGVSGELALLAGDALQPSPAGSAGARSKRARPAVQVRVSTEGGQHRPQDLQSLALHDEAVRLARSDPALVQQALGTVEHWLEVGDSRSAPLWQEWRDILHKSAWRKVLGRTVRAQQLRQASPLVTVLPNDVRQHILDQTRRLTKGVVLGEATGAEAP